MPPSRPIRNPPAGYASITNTQKPKVDIEPTDRLTDEAAIATTPAKLWVRGRLDKFRKGAMEIRLRNKATKPSAANNALVPKEPADASQHPSSSSVSKQTVLKQSDSESSTSLFSQDSEAESSRYLSLRQGRSDSSTSLFSQDAETARRRRSSTSSKQGIALTNTVMVSITHMVNERKHLNLSGTEKIISQTYVLDRHIKAIGLMAKKLNFSVSVRESGASTLRCLGLGAAAKGHDILEKTIKPASINKAYPNTAMTVMARITAAKIDGYVGHWAPQGGLQGLYVGPEARQIGNLAAQLKTTNDNKDYYPVDVDNLDHSLKALKSAPNWQSIPFTGDYDLHDMISFSSIAGPVPQSSEQEKKILSAINAAISAVDQDLRKIELTHKNVVRHGPQYSYFAHMKSKEPKGKVISDVANPSFPLAMCDRGDWLIIGNVTELESFYEERKLNLKSSWQGSGTNFTELNDGSVSHQRPSTPIQPEGAAASKAVKK